MNYKMLQDDSIDVTEEVVLMKQMHHKIVIFIIIGIFR